jgi:hypothetical protein
MSRGCRQPVEEVVFEHCRNRETTDRCKAGVSKTDRQLHLHQAPEKLLPAISGIFGGKRGPCELPPHHA